MKVLLLLGNGFSIDLLATTSQINEAPVNNLFALGDSLSWPGVEDGAFLSFAHTPNLWILGVRTSNSSEQNFRILEDIITCANAYYSHSGARRVYAQDDQRRIYINAYKELVLYLKFLFIKIDSRVRVDMLTVGSWKWADYFGQLERSRSVSSVEIVTFNYDLFLERTLNALGIDFDITVIGKDRGKKFRITKPHGSISFRHVNTLPFDAFSVNYASEKVLEGDVADFRVEMSDLNVHCPTVPLIPPAGESSRYPLSWAGKLRERALDAAKRIEEGDRVVISGLSYWHVDRREIDDILLAISDKANVSLINPRPSTTLDAVLSSIFRSYVHHQSMGNFLEANNG